MLKKFVNDLLNNCEFTRNVAEIYVHKYKKIHIL